MVLVFLFQHQNQHEQQNCLSSLGYALRAMHFLFMMMRSIIVRSAYELSVFSYGVVVSPFLSLFLRVCVRACVFRSYKGAHSFSVSVCVLIQIGKFIYTQADRLCTQKRRNVKHNKRN